MSFEAALETYEPVLGFEVHVELNTATKMFSSAPNAFGDEPNTNVNEVDLGMPGALPVVNGAAVESAIRLGLALNCQIASFCRFARKQYFYPDTPKNWQTSQYDEPIAFDGHLDIELDDGEVFRVEIERAHMEEDAGKLTHAGGTGRIQGSEYSLVDYNRSGVPLIEIVTKPITGAGARAPELARAYATAVRDIVKGLNISEARMERGNVRCDANVHRCPRDPTPSAPARRPRTSTRCAPSSMPCTSRSAVTPGCSPQAAAWSRRPGIGRRTPEPPAPGARSPTPTTIDTSPNRIWCRSA